MDFTGIEPSYFLLGLLSAFDNRFQAMADNDMKEISWKQFFAIICIDMCKESPTVKELAEIMGSSHQNVKQILLKLEKKGFVLFSDDDYEYTFERICTPDALSISDKGFDAVLTLTLEDGKVTGILLEAYTN